MFHDLRITAPFRIAELLRLGATGAMVSVLYLSLCLHASAQTGSTETAERTSESLRERLERIATEKLEPVIEGAGQIDQQEFPSGVPFSIRFTSDIKGLEAGAPVRILGKRVGTVREVSVTYDTGLGSFVAPIVIDVVPELLAIDGKRPSDQEATYQVVALLVEGGLQARASSSNLLTGEAEIDLAVAKDAKAVAAWSESPYPEIPAAPDAFLALQAALDDLLARLAGLPLEDFVQEGRLTMVALRELVTGPEIRESLSNLAAASVELQATVGRLESRSAPVLEGLAGAAEATRKAAERADRMVGNLDGTIGSKAPLWADLQLLMHELTGTARATRQLTEYLERHPEALLLGKSGGAPQ